MELINAGHNFSDIAGAAACWRTAGLASQYEVGVLSERWPGFDSIGCIGAYAFGPVLICGRVLPHRFLLGYWTILKT